MFFKSLFAAAMLVGAVGGTCAADISGAGATFPFPIYAKWADAYKKDTGNGLNYQSIGSGAGIKQIRAKTVTFGATDAPLEAKDLDKDGLAQWPMVMGGIVMVVNIPGVKPGELVLDGPTVAQIYLGKINKWNDPAIKKLNPELKLPDLAIANIHRADGSGTTFNFTYYLDQVSPEWKDKVGSATTVEWPSGIGAKGRQIPLSASKHAEIQAKLDISSNLATILLEPTQRWRMSCGWRQTGPASQIGPRAFKRRRSAMGHTH